MNQHAEAGESEGSPAYIMITEAELLQLLATVCAELARLDMVTLSIDRCRFDLETQKTNLQQRLAAHREGAPA